MNYEFPTITNISNVLPAIAGRDEFVVAVKEGYTVINYNVMMADTFPDVCEHNGKSNGLTDWYDYNAAIRRECRGIIFDNESGDILRRSFHKFFNVNEREETQDHRIDLSRPHAILEKLDGSMIAPFIVNGEMIWGTKMGATDVAKPVHEFVKNNPHYEKFACDAINCGWTPIFEWCSRKQRIVLDYKEDQLILTAMRHIKGGGYLSFDDMESIYAIPNGIPVVRRFDPQTDIKYLLEYVRDQEDLEGYVVRFTDGHMLKLKCLWYLRIHKAKEAILQDRNIVELILEDKLDDIKAHLPAEDRDRLSLFEAEINFYMVAQARQIDSVLYRLRTNNIDRKTFALEHADTIDSASRPIVFKNFDTYNIDVDSVLKILDDVKNVVRNNLSRTTKYEAIRDSWFNGVKYNAD